MKMVSYLLFVLMSFSLWSQNKIPSKEAQIKAAVQAAPEMYQQDARVIGYAEDGTLTTLREGNNGLICLADDPDAKGLSVACYSDKLADFMKRGRELEGEGKSMQEKREVRKKEIDEGSLAMPSIPAAVYVLAAEEEDYDSETGAIENGKLRYVFYKPYMTVEETGLPDKPQGKGTPWLMDANTHRSHIMVTP